METSCLIVLPHCFTIQVAQQKATKDWDHHHQACSGTSLFDLVVGRVLVRVSQELRIRQIGILNSRLPTYTTKQLFVYSTCLWLFKKNTYRTKDLILSANFGRWSFLDLLPRCIPSENLGKCRKETVYTYQGTDQCCRGIHQVQNRSEHEDCNAWSKSIWANDTVLCVFVAGGSFRRMESVEMWMSSKVICPSCDALPCTWVYLIKIIYQQL